MATEAQRQAVRRYLAQRREYKIRVRPAEDSAIRSAAAAAGQSVQRYILDAVQARMAAEAATEGPDSKTPEGEDTTEDAGTP